MPTIRELRAICQQPVLNSSGENWYGKLVSRKVSIYFTWLFVKLGLTPNQVTVVHILCGVAGAVLLTSQDTVAIVLGALLLQLWLIFDCTDGEVARYTKRFSERGIYLDYVGHYLFNAVVFFPVIVAVYRHTGRADVIALVSGLLVISAIFKRLLPDIVDIIRAKRRLETQNQRYNFSQTGPDQNPAGEVPVRRPISERAILFVYNSVTIMLVISLVKLLAIAHLDLSAVCFWAYALTLPLVVAAAFYSLLKKNFS